LDRQSLTSIFLLPSAVTNPSGNLACAGGGEKGREGVSSP
jgi:hypothetical protein